MEDVAIIGVGLHPFGRFPGKSAINMGVEATHTALRDAGLHWDDVQIGTLEHALLTRLIDDLHQGGDPVAEQPGVAAGDEGH